ncbi:type VI secretion system tip protein VgrG [Erwinia psidii]|uniref:type VI secretion system Vgr family protein n=1 Tax=Erwinia psidii TaxID=69224 RepID=UPI00226B76EC|nr:type VI secretion system Vgr family protein [Erwinia psidii]MCX8959052.1 type VI secretion system tip protein VgrG [Erwinia psidii]MCX8960204.1 type VI secretion system tip protein VgrG [Erwinia psidii]MCX8967160.1 type VI secretion system tip protein VgrG [Erwinia psidii]
MDTLQDNWLALFDGQTRYTLEINDSPLKPNVLNFHGREALNEPFKWTIEFTTAQQGITRQDVMLKYATLSMRSGRVVQGVITGFKYLKETADQTHFAVTLSSHLALLTHTRRCAVYQNVSVPELVEQILRSHDLEGSDFEFRLERAYPVRELITQWRETDLQFIQRILAEDGIWFRTGVNTTTGLDTLTFADSQLQYQFHVQLPYREPSALHDGAVEAVWDARVWHNTVTGSVATRDYNYRTASTPMDARAEVRNDMATTGEHYRYAAPYREAGDDTTSEPETESGAYYARLHHEYALNGAVRLHLFSNASHLTPGMVLETGDSDVPELKEGMVITLTTFRAARDTRLHVSVWGMPYSEQFCFRPKTAPRPVIAGTLTARVESEEKNDPYAHLDSEGRYRVKLDFSRENAEPGNNYLWIRQAKPYAGETYGWHTPLIDGTEVGIAFDGGDPDRPYIAHAFHDSEHADVVTRDNRSQNILRTAGRNELRMEDQRQAEHIALNTPFGATALNQGHVVDAQNEPRGTGFELRTDEFGVIRVAKGLLITADGQTKAEGDVLSMDEALREIDMGRQRLAQLADAERQALALEADVASQIAMFNERLKPLNEVIHFTAPEGMAFTSDEHLQLAATDNIGINASGDISTGSLGNTALLAGQTLGLFAQSGKLSLISDQGPVKVQAQNGGLHMSAAQKLSISSMSDMLFAGKKRVTLIGGGSYVKIEAGGIEYGTPHSYTRNIKRTQKLRPASQNISFPLMGTSHIYSAVYQLQDEQGKPLAGMPYRLKTPSGQDATGYSDAEGRTVAVYTREQEAVDLHVVPDKPQPEESMWFIGDGDQQQLTTEFRENV